MEAIRATEASVLSFSESLTDQFSVHRAPLTPPDTDGILPTLAGSCESRLHLTQGLKADVPLPPPPHTPTEVLDIDRATPDDWIPRDPRLVRLTGAHPLNVEAPLRELYDEGFLTSPELFYVRNHGAVPRVEDNDALDWEFSVDGLVQFPLRLTLRDLIAQFSQVTAPVTLVCAGNRRKEQNIVRKSKGFSWGAAGCSTALWTGVPLSEVIKRAVPKRGARYVCMEGADELPNGYYGTSVKLSWVLDPGRGIMLAHLMNGQALSPDHGKPLRVVVPGQIGGRSVKWLKRLTVTDRPSDNWYHIYDNRVLPTMVSPEESAHNTEWWMDERYAIYDLSPNSAIAYPAHDETIDLENSSSYYTIKGYAYSGGGRQITRVEISLNKGSSWLLAEISYLEDAYRTASGKFLYGGRLDSSWSDGYFCWCFWSLSVPVSDLKVSADILVRAMDDSMNIQPRDMYWSVLGMMNNPWYRVCILNSGETLRFEHPTQPGLLPGGWMERVKMAGGNLMNGRWGEQLAGQEVKTANTEQSAQDVTMISSETKRVISLAELQSHENNTAPWFVIRDEVYDGELFLKDHPGGAASIIAVAGQDCTEEFMAIHSVTAKAMMPRFHIGTLAKASLAILNTPVLSQDELATPSSVFLDPRKWKAASLVAKTSMSWNSRLLTFSLQHDAQLLGLPTGQHIMVRLRDDEGSALIRAYTPISSASSPGTVDLLVKVYFDTQGNSSGGRMSQALDRLNIGAEVEFKGPFGKFEYIGRGICTVSNSKKQVDDFVMVAGGTGITPILQVLSVVLSDAEDSTRCVVLDCNRKEEDILCRERLDKLLQGQSHRCTLIHTLTQPPDGWTGMRGRIGEAVLTRATEHLEPHRKKAMILVCGPPAMEKSVKRSLKMMGWADDQVVFF